MKRHILAFSALLLMVSQVAWAQSIMVRHWSTYARSGLKLDIGLTGQAAYDQLVVTLGGIEAYRKAGAISAHEVAHLRIDNLAEGDYPMAVRLLDSEGTEKAVFEETIHKYGNGTPSVAFDEYNNLVVNGTPRFLITPWMENVPNYTLWYRNGEFTNYGWNSDYATAYSAEQLRSMIDSVIGDSPGGVITSGSRRSGTISSYVSNASISSRTLMWFWVDEPDLNGVTPQQVTAMTNEAHANDPNQRPVIVDFYGYAPAMTIQGRGYAYPNIVADAMSFDLYPVIHSHKRSTAPLCVDGQLSYGGCRVTFKQWVDVFEAIKGFNYDLTYINPIIEMAGERDGTHPNCTSANPCRGPNANQFKMELWLATVHGAKGLTMWTSLKRPGEPAAEVHDVLRTFRSQLDRGLEAAILAPPTSRSVTSSRTIPGYRVDAMVREDAETIWVFAVRITDDIANPSEATFTPLPTQLTVSSLIGSKTVVVFDEGRTLDVTDGVIVDTFDPYAVHIYRIPKGVSSNPGALSPPRGLRLQ